MEIWPNEVCDIGLARCLGKVAGTGEKGLTGGENTGIGSGATAGVSVGVGLVIS